MNTLFGIDMCGIIAYKGNRKASPILHKSLLNLEYRGYDSAGMATINGGTIYAKKDVGRVAEVDKKHDFNSMTGNIGIAHTRWATTGSVRTENSHPHVSSDGRLAIVHNGIIENYNVIKTQLVDLGYKFKSGTDTEVATHLISHYLSDNNIEEAVRKAFLKFKGRNALVVMDKETNKIIGIRDGSPLVYGHGNQESFIASDIPAFLEHTNKVVFLNDKEMISIGDSIGLYDVNTGERLKIIESEIDWNIEMAKKGEHPHFMLKEILEQGTTLARATNQNKEQIYQIVKELKDAKHIILVGCGTTGKVAHIGQYLFSTIAEKHVQTTFGSEFEQVKPIIGADTVLLVISQSGETADTLEVIKYAKSEGAKIISIINVEGSTIMRLSDYSLLINAGVEKAVASTKATNSQIGLLIILANALKGDYSKGIDIVIEASQEVNRLLNKDFIKEIKELAKRLSSKKDIYIIGRGVSYPTALECGIKIQEVSYIHAEGIAGGELKHYAIALIEKNSPVVVLAPNDNSRDDIINNAREIKARGGFIIGVSPTNSDVFDYHIKIPDLDQASPIACLVPNQLLAYFLSVLKGHDPDYPKNLAKSVTVK